MDLLIISAGFFVALFILDNVVASNRGFSRNPLVVLLNPCIKCTKRKQKKVNSNEITARDEG